MLGRKILVIRGGAIGDFILTLPVLQALRDMFPGVRIEVMGYSHIAELARWGGLAEHVQPLETREVAGFFARGGTLDPKMRAFFNGFGLMVSYLYDPDAYFQGNILRVSDAQFVQGPHRPDEADGMHATEALLKPLEHLAIFGAGTRPRLMPPSPPARQGGTRIGLHPGSGSESKNWPVSHWEELAGSLRERRDWSFLLVGGEAEGERLDRVQAVLPAERTTVLRNQPLTVVAEALTSCQAFVGHDSGITHLASALDVPCRVLWGPTREHVWRPLGERVQVLSAPSGLSGLKANSVLTALQGAVAEVAS